MNYTVTANDGLSPGPGSWNQVQLGANRYNYDLYRNTANCTQVWGTAGMNDFSGTLNFGASSTASLTVPFCLRVFGNQTVVLPAGNYTDTVNVTLNPAGGGNTISAPLSVTVITDNWCQITVPPGNISFIYTSFQAAPAPATSTYGVRCTSLFPYNMSLDGTQPYNLLGLDYTLSIPASSVGTGLTQTHTINGSIAAGQAGACATGVCNGTQTRTLTISW
jgi:spore coat protein U-like protein